MVARVLKGVGGTRWGLVASFGSGLLLACGRPPPASRFPSAAAAIERMRASVACSRGLAGEVRLDFLGDQGRLRAKALYALARPSRIRFDTMNPLGGVLSTLTSDGDQFALLDMQQGAFVVGPASECNIEQVLRVPIPGPALAELMTGLAPMVRHKPADAELSWVSSAFTLQVLGAHQVVERVRLVPRIEDYDRPWQQQRVRVLGVVLEQAGRVLYRVRLADHAAASTAAARVDPDGIDAPIFPSGPSCRAEVPRRLRFTVPDRGTDVTLEQLEVHHNPPLAAGLFAQQAPPGAQVRPAPCSAQP